MPRKDLIFESQIPTSDVLTQIAPRFQVLGIWMSL